MANENPIYVDLQNRFGGTPDPTDPSSTNYPQETSTDDIRTLNTFPGLPDPTQPQPIQLPQQLITPTQTVSPTPAPAAPAAPAAPVPAPVPAPAPTPSPSPAQGPDLNVPNYTPLAGPIVTGQGPLSPGQALNLSSNIDLAKAARTEQAGDIQAQGEAQKGSIYNKSADDLQVAEDNLQKWHKYVNDEIMRKNEAQDKSIAEAAAMKVDPDHWFASKNTANKWLTGIALTLGNAFGAAGQGLTRGAAPNLSAGLMQQAIENDVAAQKANIANKYQNIQAQQTSKENSVQYNTMLEEQAAAHKLVLLKVTEQRLNQIAAQTQSPLTKINAANAAGDIKKQIVAQQGAYGAAIAAASAARTMQLHKEQIEARDKADVIYKDTHIKAIEAGKSPEEAAAIAQHAVENSGVGRSLAGTDYATPNQKSLNARSQVDPIISKYTNQGKSFEEAKELAKLELRTKMPAVKVSNLFETAYPKQNVKNSTDVLSQPVTGLGTPAQKREADIQVDKATDFLFKKDQQTGAVIRDQKGNPIIDNDRIDNLAGIIDPTHGWQHASMTLRDRDKYNAMVMEGVAASAKDESGIPIRNPELIKEIASPYLINLTRDTPEIVKQKVLDYVKAKHTERSRLYPPSHPFGKPLNITDFVDSSGHDPADTAAKAKALNNKYTSSSSSISNPNKSSGGGGGGGGTGGNYGGMPVGGS